MPEPENPEIEPPEKVMSEAVKSVEVSESLKVRFAVSPAFREETSELMAMVGAANAASSERLLMPVDE